MTPAPSRYDAVVRPLLIAMCLVGAALLFRAGIARLTKPSRHRGNDADVSLQSR